MDTTRQLEHVPDETAPAGEDVYLLTVDGEAYRLVREASDVGGDGLGAGSWGIWSITDPEGVCYENINPYMLERRSFHDTDGVYYMIQALYDSSLVKPLSCEVAVAAAAVIDSGHSYAVGSEEHERLRRLDDSLTLIGRRALTGESTARTEHRTGGGSELERLYDAAVEETGLGGVQIHLAARLVAGGVHVRDALRTASEI